MTGSGHLLQPIGGAVFYQGLSFSSVILPPSDYWSLIKVMADVSLELFSLVLIVSVKYVCPLTKAPIRDTEYGRVQGVVTTPIPGRMVANYLGIPYAKPPINNLRFEVRYC